MTSVNPNQYDDGSGVLQTVANNRFTVQRVYFLGAGSNKTFIHYGQTEYNTIADAEAGINADAFVENGFLHNDTALRTFLIVKKSTTDLTNLTENKFITASRFGGGGVSSGGGSGVTTLQGAYENSAVNPEIQVNSTNGALTIRRGS